MSDVGRITFGPIQTMEEARRNQYRATMLQNQTVTAASAFEGRMCNCMGPQFGETKCPCQLAAEMQKGSEMIQSGVTINGRKYRLVPEN